MGTQLTPCLCPTTGRWTEKRRSEGTSTPVARTLFKGNPKLCKSFILVMHPVNGTQTLMAHARARETSRSLLCVSIKVVQQRIIIASPSMFSHKLRSIARLNDMLLAVCMTAASSVHCSVRAPPRSGCRWWHTPSGGLRVNFLFRFLFPDSICHHTSQLHAGLRLVAFPVCLFLCIVIMTLQTYELPDANPKPPKPPSRPPPLCTPKGLRGGARQKDRQSQLASFSVAFRNQKVPLVHMGGVENSYHVVRKQRHSRGEVAKPLEITV